MSSAIAKIDYNEKTETLLVKFVKGGTHVYNDVPKLVVDQFKEASSLGKYFNENIRNSF